MSTLKFKSKIEVPGIDLKGENIENVGSIIAETIYTELIKNNSGSLTLDSQETAPVIVNYIKSNEITLGNNTASGSLT